MKKVSRREVLAAAALAGAGVAAGVAGRLAQGPALTPGGQVQAGPAAAYAPRPLPACAHSSAAMSRQLLTGHHERHYGGDVERLNAIRSRLAALPEDAPAYLTAALKREELRALNSIVLHELYFEGLGGGAGPCRELTGLIEGAFGSLARWRQDFTSTAMSLAGGQGWVTLAYLPERGQLLNAWMHDSLVSTASATPLIVLDMYEHAYKEDFGRDVRAYVEAFHGCIDWRAVAARAGTTHGASVAG